KTGAGQYFTPRALIRAIRDVMRPTPAEAIHDPACETGGLLLAGHEYISARYALDSDQKRHLHSNAISGCDVVDRVPRLGAMHVYLRGIGGDDAPVTTYDSLTSPPSTNYDIVMTNPPFGKKSSIAVINEEGEESKEKAIYYRDDFWATTSNKQ